MKEVKPFATKIRDYLSAYEGLDPSRTVTTDFDLPASYNALEGRIIPSDVKIVDDVLVGTNTDLETYPNKNWLDNSSYSIIKVTPVNEGHGYTTPPSLTLQGGGGSGTVLKAFLGSKGNVSAVGVIAPGTGYYSAPKVIINGNELDDESMQEGKTLLSFPAGGVGTKNIEGEFQFTEEGELISIPVSTSYEVVPKPNKATISADKMNVVYNGVCLLYTSPSPRD